jgi:hypothetical protein
LAAELGIPLALAVAVGWIAVLFILGRACVGQRRDATISLMAFSVALIALIHSSIDFPLQISGYAIVVFVVVGLGLGRALRTSKADVRHAES